MVRRRPERHHRLLRPRRHLRPREHGRALPRRDMQSRQNNSRRYWKFAERSSRRRRPCNGNGAKRLIHAGCKRRRGHRDIYHTIRQRTSRRRPRRAFRSAGRLCARSSPIGRQRRGRDWYQWFCRSVTGRRCGIPAIHRTRQRQPTSRGSARNRNRIVGSTQPPASNPRLNPALPSSRVLQNS
jgi:hypothetical protein